MEDDTIKNLDDDSLMKLLSELEELDDVCDELIKKKVRLCLLITVRKMN